MRGYRGKRLQIESKAGNEPVTEADRAANTLIVARLTAAFPDDIVLSEEVPGYGRAARPPARLDGRSHRRHQRLHPGRHRLRGDDRPVRRRPPACWARSRIRCRKRSTAAMVGAGAWVEDAPRRPHAAAHLDHRARARHPAGGLEDPPDAAHRSHQAGAADPGRDERRQRGPEDRPRQRGRARPLRLHRRPHQDLGHLRAGGDPARRRRRHDRRRRRAARSTTAQISTTGRGIVASNGPLHPFVIETLAPFVRTTD